MRRKQRDDRLLKPGMYAGLKFDDGWWFIQVIGQEYVEAKPVLLENSNGNRSALSADTSGVETDEIQDSQNNNILEPESNERNTINQILYGIAPSRMQVFEKYGRERNMAVQDYDEPNDPGAYVSGFDSPYDNPSQDSELFYINSMAPLRLQAYNPMSESAEARLSFHVNKLRYTTVTDRGLMKAMLQGQQPAHLVMMGGGAQNKDQIGIPSWLNEAFGEHIHDTSSILDANSSGGAGGTVPTDSTSLEGV